MRSMPIWLVVLIKSAILLFVVITTFAYAMLAERKVMGWMQLRPGPNRVGPWGLLQPAADAAKLMLKEDLMPRTADPLIYRLAPFISLLTAFSVYAIIPFGASSAGAWSIGNVNAGVLFLLRGHVARRLRHIARRVGIGIEVPVARKRAIDGADDQLRVGHGSVVRRRADPRGNDLARRHRQRAAAPLVFHSAVRRRSSSMSSPRSPRRTARRSIWSRRKPSWSRVSTPNTRAFASGCSSSPNT